MSHQPESLTSPPSPDQNPKTEPPSPQKATTVRSTFSDEELYALPLDGIWAVAETYGEIQLEGPFKHGPRYRARIAKVTPFESGFWARGASDVMAYAIIHAIQEAHRLSRP
jgi:hypothetical protein